MRNLLLVTIFLLISYTSNAQFQISGKIRSVKPISISLEDLNGKVILKQDIAKGGIFETEAMKIATDLYNLKIGSTIIPVLLENKPIKMSGFYNNDMPTTSEITISGEGTVFDKLHNELKRTYSKSAIDGTELVKKYSSKELNEQEQFSILSAINFNPEYLPMDYEIFVGILKQCSSAKSSTIYSRIEKIKNNYSVFALNTPAYNFTAKDENGKKYSLSDFKGKIVLLDFWASWCGPCRAEMKSLHKIYEDIKGDDLQFISISLDDTKEKWMTALKADSSPWLGLFEGITNIGSKSNPGFYDSVIRPMYGFRQIPFIVLIDKEGKTVKRFLRGEDVRTEIELLRKNKK